MTNNGFTQNQLSALCKKAWEKGEESARIAYPESDRSKRKDWAWRVASAEFHALTGGLSLVQSKPAPPMPIPEFPPHGGSEL